MERAYSEGLLRNGIVEAKSGDHDAARRYLQRAVDISGDHDVLSEAWYWLSKITDDPDEKRSALENCLSLDMQHIRARRELAILKGDLDEKEIINPDALPTPSTDPTQADADRFTCPQCGGRMSFTPDGSMLVCEFCSRDQTLGSTADAEEKDFLIAMATARGHSKPVAVQVFHCQGCGAEFILPPDVLSATCAYCHSVHVVSLEDSRELLQPEGIIPHAFNQSQATQRLVNWVEENGIKPKEKVELPRGLYLPVWTFDIGGGIGYRGNRYESDDGLTHSKGIVHVENVYPVHIDDLPVPASRKVADNLMRLLPTYDLKEIRPYDPGYLANWTAEVYDVSMADASLEARSRAYAKLKRDLPGDVTSLYDLTTSSASLSIESFKLVLIPLWIAEILVNSKTMILLINGQNGIVQGDSPGQEEKVDKESGLIDWLDDLLDD